MNWTINYSSQANKFLKKNPARSDLLKESLRIFIRKLSGETVSIDLTKMKGKWKGTYRIRRGDIRIILSFDYDAESIHVLVVDFRGDVYK